MASINGLSTFDLIECEGLAMFAAALALGLEDVVAKDSKSPYVEGSAKNRSG
jgi:ATP-dependent DNA ligase